MLLARVQSQSMNIFCLLLIMTSDWQIGTKMFDNIFAIPKYDYRLWFEVWSTFVSFFMISEEQEHWQYADNITLVWNIVIHIWKAWIVFDNIDNMQRAEASELIRLMTSSRAVCSREEHGTDKCQNISPILSTYWHCIMLKKQSCCAVFWT